MRSPETWWGSEIRGRVGVLGSGADRLVAGFKVRVEGNRVMKIFASATGLMVVSHMRWEKKTTKGETSLVGEKKIKCSVLTVLV